MQNLFEGLNAQQQQAVTHLDGPLLVLAGAGSGKTRIVTFRIAHLIKNGVHPSEILAVTFTNKAAGEMQERISHLTKAQGFSTLPLICTFHSLGARILRESIQYLGYSPHFIIYDEEDSQKLLKGCLETLGISKELIEPKTLKGLISSAKNQLLEPSDCETLEQGSYPQAFAQIYRLYQERLKEANAVDFDDLLFLTVQLLKKNEDLLAYYQKRWRYLLIDEYQDTNQAQYLLSRFIVQKSHNLFVVGDPDQSIYSWRGANIRNILNFEKDYPGAKVVYLEQNYRSHQNILEAANALIQHNSSRYEKRLWSEKAGGEKILLFVGQSDRHEAEFIVEEIARLHRVLQIPYNEMSIFYRTNFQSRNFEDALLRMKIPYVIVGGISFYHRREIKDVLAFLHMILSNQDIIAFGRTINIPKRGIGDSTLEKLRQGARASGLSLLEICQTPPSEIRLTAKQKESLRAYAELIKDLRTLQESLSLDKLLLEVVRKSGYLDFLKEDKETYEDRKANIEELISKAVEWSHHTTTPTLEGFLEELSLKSSVDDVVPQDDQVHLMTFHNGKGLEFNVVFLVGMEEDLFPHANSRESYEGLEEERRLCYVGMTRAKERLYLTAAETRFLWGTFRRMRPSRFLKEVPRDFIERIR